MTISRRTFLLGTLSAPLMSPPALLARRPCCAGLAGRMMRHGAMPDRDGTVVAL